MTVYWDIFFLINFLIDYLIIYSTSKIGYIDTNIYKMFLASLIGGVSSILIFDVRYPLNLIIYVFVSLVINYIAFLKINFKIISIFYIVSFIYGGIGNYVNNIFGVMRMESGFVSLRTNIPVVILAIILCTFMVIIVLKFLNRNVLKNSFYREIEIINEGKSVKVTGYMDTGNMLLDPITQYPVILVDYNRIEYILSDALKMFLEKGTDLSYNINRKYINKIRLIPYKNSSSESILKGFKPDYVVIKGNEEKRIKDVIIAVTYDALSENNEFNAILNPQI